jgi:TfoX/Sxy family transcriptional regulator of competence genes
MPYDHFLAECIRDIFTEMGINCEVKPMMGILCFMVNGRMCVGILDQRLIIRINPADEPVALAKPGCKPMYFTGRLMNDFMFIDPNGTRSREQLLEWVEFALKCNREQNESTCRGISEEPPLRKTRPPRKSNNPDPAC